MTANQTWNSLAFRNLFSFSGFLSHWSFLIELVLTDIYLHLLATEFLYLNRGFYGHEANLSKWALVKLFLFLSRLALLGGCKHSPRVLLKKTIAADAFQDQDGLANSSSRFGSGGGGCPWILTRLTMALCCCRRYVYLVVLLRSCVFEGAVVEWKRREKERKKTDEGFDREALRQRLDSTRHGKTEEGRFFKSRRVQRSLQGPAHQRHRHDCRQGRPWKFGSSTSNKKLHATNY